jgi:hypothetical protein
LELQGALETHRISQRASLFFTTSFDSWARVPVAGYLSLGSLYQP